MKILILNTHNPLKDSGSVALDLFHQLKEAGHDVRVLVNSYDKDYPEGILSMESHLSAGLKELADKFEWRLLKLRQLLKLKDKIRRDPNYRFFQLNERIKTYSTYSLLKSAGNKIDIIIILFAKNFINAKNIYELSNHTGAKIFWLMFDMAPFTGGCHYAWDCKGYQDSCGNCPALYSSNPLDSSHKNLSYKKEYLDKINIQILAGSEWQYRQAVSSTLFKKKTIHKMLIPVDPDVFRPVDKEGLRKKLGIPAEKKVIFFGAVGLTEARKGMNFLIESLKCLKELLLSTHEGMEKNILLVAAGRGFNEIVSLLPFESHHLGYLDNNFGIASAYQVADVFLCPSIEDSGPMMINQSIMSGTPVVSFEMGVSADLVINGQTGYRAGLKDSKDMARGILSIMTLEPDEYKKLSIRCRDLGMKLCSPKVRMQQLENLMKN